MAATTATKMLTPAQVARRERILIRRGQVMSVESFLLRRRHPRVGNPYGPSVSPLTEQPDDVGCKRTPARPHLEDLDKGRFR